MSLVWDRLDVFLFSRLPGHQNRSLLRMVLVYIYHWKNFPMKHHFIGLFVWLYLRSVYRNFLKMQGRYSSNPSFRAIVKSKSLDTLRSCPILILSVSRFLKNSIILCKIFGRNHISILLTSSCRLSKKKIFFWHKTTSINYFSRLLDRASIDPHEFFFCNIAMKVLVSCIGWRLFQQCQLRRILFSEKKTINNNQVK